MGLTAESTGLGAVDGGLVIHRESPDDKVIALAGNPNVGKSTVFNGLTGMNQHTGNWPGKTVTNAQGYCRHQQTGYVMVDIPGTYSLMAHSAEEEVARDFICFGEPDAVTVVCDATCLERNMNLVLQTMEITDKVIVCVNMMDEAKRKNIHIDCTQLAENLGVPVVGITARSKRDLDRLMDTVRQVAQGEITTEPTHIRYTKPIEAAIACLQPVLENHLRGRLNARWVSLKLLERDDTLIQAMESFLELSLTLLTDVGQALGQAEDVLRQSGIDSDRLKDNIVSCIVLRAEEICMDVVPCTQNSYQNRDRKIDHILTSKVTGIPLMIVMLLVVFWLTITGANYPSQMLTDGFTWFEGQLNHFFVWINAPAWLHSMLVDGVYRVLSWVVAVMLPPMAIFFPLFTLLEDLGYLPRVAFNLDKYFKKACTCGKQSLTMCMGFGCNAAGVVGCRIIDSPRERLIATITNNFVPCNGRFPTIISIITMFFIGASVGLGASVLSAVILTGVIVLGVITTLLISKMLSKTILKGVPSSFTLELPPYRRPQIGKLIVRSIFDRTLFVLGRAVAVAAPAGLVIWLMANITVGDVSVLTHCAAFLDPFARLMGLDGIILMAFILGFPANEIVVPIIIMAYMAQGSLVRMEDLTELHTLFINNGWTPLTAICMILFSLMHWPCSTTCMTIKKETQSVKWTVISFLVPTITGIVVCMAVAGAARLIGLA